MSVRLNWRGAAVRAKVMRAAVAAIDETTKAAADDAQASHWWQARRAQGLEAQIATEDARIEGARAVGAFGTTKLGFYGLFHERKTPFLRPAADREFPKLARRIKDKL